MVVTVVVGVWMAPWTTASGQVSAPAEVAVPPPVQPAPVRVEERPGPFETVEAAGVSSPSPVGWLVDSGLVSDLVVFDGDFPDPDLVVDGESVYVYATNTLWSNVPVLAAVDGEPLTWIGDALPQLPTWSEPNWVWAPSVTEIADQWVLHYTTRHRDSGRQCVSVATSDSPAGPYVDASTEPLVCALDEGGAIDPSVVADGDWVWLLWKSDGNCCGRPTVIYAQELSDDGTRFVGEPSELIRNDLAWERDVVEGPSMIERDGVWHLFYAANRWDTVEYRTGHAVCASVSGPCVKDPEPWLVADDVVAGPGGLEIIELVDSDQDLAVYHGWDADQIGYPGGLRKLYVQLVSWVDGQPVLERTS